MVDRDVEADDPAVTSPEDLDAVDLQLAQELDGVLGHVVVVERTFRGIGGATVTHLLRRDHLKRRKEGQIGRRHSIVDVPPCKISNGRPSPCVS